MHRTTIAALALCLLAGCVQQPSANRPARPEWPDLPNDARPSVACIFALDAKTAWVGGDVRTAPGPIHSFLYGTADGGRSWHATGPAVPRSTILAIFFLDTRHGWAAGAWTQESTGDPFVLRTRDGGATWTRSDLPMPTRGTCLSCPKSIEFITPSVGILQAEVCIVGDEQQVFVTRDGGKTWTFSHGRQAEVGRANALSVTREGFLWKIEGNRVLVSSDNGTHWRETPAQPIATVAAGR